MSSRKAFEEAVWQLTRPLNKANVRVLALEPGGPPRLASAPRIDPATKRALVDTIDPASLPAALGSVRGQTVLVTGRVDGRVLYVQPSSGPEHSLLLPDLFKAAEEADVNLVVLRAASTPRQPGGRNWLWQKVEVKGLEQAMQHARVADFLNALGGPNARLAVSANPSGRRTALDIKPAADLAGGPLQSPVGDLFSGIVSDITGRVVTTGLQANLRSAERQPELDQRLIPGIPSDFQVGYLVLVLLGLFGVPVSRAWWRRLWPPEAATEYAGRAGYWRRAPCAALAFLLLFLPLTAPVSAPYNLARQIYEVDHDAGALVALADGAAHGDCQLSGQCARGTAMATLKGKTLFITGASRGIGLAIALRAARDGANIAIAAKTAEPHPKLEGTIFTAAKEIEQAGGKALPIACDIRFEEQVQAAVEQTVATFGGLDICVNNASAISLTHAVATDMKRYDLMHGINARGTFLVSKTCIPHLKKAANPHILMLSPPLDMDPKWFAPHVAYTMAKFNMSIIALGLSGELKGDGIAVNTLWPRTTIATAAVKNLLGGEALMRMSRTPGDHGRCGAPDPHAGCQDLHRALLHRRHAALRARCQGLREVPRRSELRSGARLLRAGFDAAAARRLARRAQAMRRA